MVRKPMNWALYAEWKNQEQQCRCRGLLKTLSDAEEKTEVTNDANLQVNSECTKHGLVVLKEVLRYMDFVDNLVLDLEVQKGLARDVHDDVQRANMWAQGLMDDRINNLKLATKRLGTLVLALATIVSKLDKQDETKCGKEELQKKAEGLQKRIKYQNCQIEDYHELAKEGKMEFEKNCQDCEILSNRVLGEKKKKFLAK